MVQAFGMEEVIALTNLDDPDATTINSDILTKAIEDASASADGYLQTRYSTPLNPVPPYLKRICCDITRGLLDQNNPREEVVRRWDLALAFLKDVSKGLASLPVPNGGVDDEGGIPEYVSSLPVFTLDSLRDF